MNKKKNSCHACHEHHEEQTKSECSSCTPRGRRWYTDRLFLVTLFIIVVLGIDLVLEQYGITILRGLRIAFFEYLGMVWLPMAVGLLVGGFIDHFVPEEFVASVLSRRRKRTILYAVGLGFLSSACSHGVLAIAMELYKKRAGTPAVIAFLLASPWANLPVTILLFGFFGVKAGFIVGSALVIAVVTGLVYQVLDRKGLIENRNNSSAVQGVGATSVLTRRMKEHELSVHNIKRHLVGVLRGSWDLSRMVLWWVLLGMLLASIARAYVPSSFFKGYMGPDIFGLIVTLVLATVIEVCSEGTAPLAFEIFRQTGAFGNAFVFLMAGVVTDYTEIGLIWSNIGRRAAIWLPIVTVPQVLLLGWLFNVFL